MIQDTEQNFDDELFDGIDYRAFLDEIENEDEDLQELDKEFDEETTKEEVAITDSKTKKTSDKFAREQAIKRMALDQNIIDLNARVSDTNFKALIVILTKKHAAIISKYEAYITKRISRLLLRLMPHQVRTCWAKYRHCIVPSPGFIWEVQTRHETISIPIYPDVPLFFDIQTEREQIKSRYPEAKHFLNTIDQAICRLRSYQRAKAKREVQLANMLVRNNIRTYMDLLRDKPFLFEILFNYLKDKQNERIDVSQ